MGGWPPLGEASVSSTPASLKTKKGAATSSSQKPVGRPVLPSWWCEVSTIRIFIFFSPLRLRWWVAIESGKRSHQIRRVSCKQLDDGINRYQGIADTIVQLFCLSASGFIGKTC